MTQTNVTTKISAQQIQSTLAIAFDAAARATDEYDKTHDWFPCGFAWVKIRPARGPLVKYLVDHKLGWVDTFSGGLTVYNPSGSSTQSMNAKIQGAKAFAKVLQESGILGKCDVKVESRID